MGHEASPIFIFYFSIRILKYIFNNLHNTQFKKILIIVDNKKESDSLYFIYCQYFLIIN